MTFDQADALCDEIIAFLLECGGPYVESTKHLETLLMFCLGSGQFALGQGDGIEWFFHWVRVREEDIEGIAEDVFPAELARGDCLYVCNAASKVGSSVLRRELKKIPHRKAFWHRGKRIKEFGGNHGQSWRWKEQKHQHLGPVNRAAEK